MAFSNSALANQDGPVSYDELKGQLALHTETVKNNAGEVIAGAVIGFIAGAIAAEALDLQISRGDHRDRRNGRWNPPRRTPPRPQVVCYAQNTRGMVFRAYGYVAQQAQRQALNLCYANSFACRPMGCKINGR